MMLTQTEVENKYDLTLREWAYFAGNNNDAMASIKFGELWAYGAILQYDAKRIGNDILQNSIGFDHRSY